MTNKVFIQVIKYINNLIKDTKFDTHVYVVGGAVRDLLMENEIKDIDIVIDLPNGGIDFSKYLYSKNLLTHEPVIYPNYGTSMFTLKEFQNLEIECVHTRKEQYKERNLSQEFGTLKEDIYSRDFTCNTLLYDISDNKIIDITGYGLKDIKDKIIRSPRALIINQI